MNNRTEAKLTDLSGMQKGIEGILQQAWERGRKYEQNEERPQGRWIPQTDFDGFTYWKCSKCNKKNDFEIFNFCPNCGADMRGGRE